MRSFIFKVLDCTIRILVRVRNRFATPNPRLYRVLRGNRRMLACSEILMDPAYNARSKTDAYDIADMKRQIVEAWSVEDILAREG